MTIESVKKDAVLRREFAAVELSHDGDISTAQQTALAQASIQSRYVMAERHPRNWDIVRQSLVKECSRPEFAMDKSALYHKPIGDGIEGLGIRFAEVAARCMNNIIAESATISEDDYRRIVRVTVTDLENNLTYSKDIVVVKTVERLQLKKDDVTLSHRTNSRNEVVYTIPASEDSLMNKENALISKAVRNGILRLVPGDLQQLCEDTIRDVRDAKVKENPDAAKNKIIDAFATLNISVVMLEEYLEHPVGQCTPAEIVNLQALYGALKDGEATWRSVMDNLEDMRKLQPKKKPEEAKAKGTEGAKARATEKEEAKLATAKATTNVTPEEKKPAEVKPEAQKETKKAEPKIETKPVPDVEKKVEPSKAENTETTKESEKPAPATTSEAKGKVIKTKGHPEGVVFPVNIKRTSDEDGYTEEQYARAEKAIKQLGAQFNLQDTAMSFFSVGIEEFSGEAMTQFIAVLESWK